MSGLSTAAWPSAITTARRLGPALVDGEGRTRTSRKESLMPDYVRSRSLALIGTIVIQLSTKDKPYEPLSCQEPNAGDGKLPLN